MPKSISQQIKDIDLWLRLAVFLHGPLKQHLLIVLHNKNNQGYQGLPEDPTELYKELSTVHYGTIIKLRRKRVLNDDQLEVLLPTNGENKTYSDTFDVTLLVVLIINFTTLPSPVNGWNQKVPHESDTSIAANVLRARAWRNFLNHSVANGIDKALSDRKWTEAANIIKGLDGSVDATLELKTISLDPKNEIVVKSLMEFNERKIERIQAKIDDNHKDVSKRLSHQNEAITNAAKQIDKNSGEIEENRRELSKCLDQQISMKRDNEKILAECQFVLQEVEQLKKLKKENSLMEDSTGNNTIISICSQKK